MKIQLGNTDYSVKDLTIEQYLLLKDNNDIKPDELIAMLTDAPIKEVRKAPFAQLSFVAKYLTSNLMADETTPLNIIVDFKGVRYGLIKPSQISYEEWINLEVFMAESPIDILKMATHLYKPLKNDKVGEERELVDYSLDECISRMEEFKKFPINSVFSALFFLTTFVQELTKASLSSLETKLKGNKTNEEIKINETNQKTQNNL